jgi:hypothetical protein
MYRLFKFVPICAGLILMLGVSFVSFFGFKVCLATDVKGDVTLNGKPVAKAKVIWEILFDGQKLMSESITDEMGNFFLPAVYDRSIWKYTPFEIVIGQTINIEYESKTYLAFGTSKRNFDLGGELNSPIVIASGGELTPFILTCELTNKDWTRVRKENDTHAIWGVCLIPGEKMNSHGDLK